MRRWIPFCCAVAFVATTLATISTLAYFSYAAFDREATTNTATIAREPRATAWLERYASPPLPAIAPPRERFVPVHFQDHWREDHWGDDVDPDSEPGTTYKLGGAYARVAYDARHHIVVSRFYDKYKTPEGTLVRVAPQPPLPIPQTDATAMRSVRGLAVAEPTDAFARAGYPVPRERAIYHLPGPCRRSNPCAALLFAQTAGDRIDALYFYRTYYNGTEPAPAPPSDDERPAPNEHLLSSREKRNRSARSLAARIRPERVGFRNMRQMKVDKLGIDLLTHDPVVILKDLEGKRFLPILIGPFEATAIALALEGTSVPRPLSHDLMRTMLETLHASLEQIVIHDIKDSTFFAKLIVRSNGDTQEIDARPSDGIALALRMQAPIYVSDKIVLEETVADKKAEAEESQRFKRFIEELKPGDFKE
jgi:bifunctional DNase/RNase